MKKRLKPGQLFTMYNHVWQVRKCTRWPCSVCEIYPYWRSSIVKIDDYPCNKLCLHYKEIIPSDCVAVLIKRK